MLHTRTIKLRLTALDAIVHGAGTNGNEQILRTQEVVIEDRGKARRVRVPFISGNSIKHRIRAAGAAYAIHAMGVERNMTKAMVDLLLSGGHLSKSGTAIDLAMARRIEALIPIVSLCGASYGNTMTESKIHVDNAHLVCLENSYRIPQDLASSPYLALPAADMITSEFGTRHDQADKLLGRKLLADSVGEERAVMKTAKLLDDGKKGAKKEKADKGDSAQMIYNFQAISAGSRLWTEVRVAELTAMEMFALRSAFYTMSTAFENGLHHMGLGAKNSIGWGRVAVEFASVIRVPVPEMTSDTTSIATLGDTDQGAYNEHLRSRSDEILAVLREATS